MGSSALGYARHRRAMDCGFALLIGGPDCCSAIRLQSRAGAAPGASAFCVLFPYLNSEVPTEEVNRPVHIPAFHQPGGTQSSAEPSSVVSDIPDSKQRTVMLLSQPSGAAPNAL